MTILSIDNSHKNAAETEIVADAAKLSNRSTSYLLRQNVARRPIDAMKNLYDHYVNCRMFSHVARRYKQAQTTVVVLCVSCVTSVYTHYNILTPPLPSQ